MIMNLTLRWRRQTIQNWTNQIVSYSDKYCHNNKPGNITEKDDWRNVAGHVSTDDQEKCLFKGGTLYHLCDTKETGVKRKSGQSALSKKKTNKYKSPVVGSEAIVLQERKKSQVWAIMRRGKWKKKMLEMQADASSYGAFRATTRKCEYRSKCNGKPLVGFKQNKMNWFMCLKYHFGFCMEKERVERTESGKTGRGHQRWSGWAMTLAWTGVKREMVTSDWIQGTFGQ